jgi:hypothetical protein
MSTGKWYMVKKTGMLGCAIHWDAQPAALLHKGGCSSDAAGAGATPTHVLAQRMFVNFDQQYTVEVPMHILPRLPHNTNF